jgi:hypothetical protein
MNTHHQAKDFASLNIKDLIHKGHSATSRISLPVVPNFSRVLTVQIQEADLPVKKKKLTGKPTMRAASQVKGVKRWDAKSHKSSDWDGLRRVSSPRKIF